MKEKLQNGFPLENPDVLLEWNAPLDELAKKSGGVWRGDRYYWPRTLTYLGGLNFPLSSVNGIAQNAPFIGIWADIGRRDEDLLWDDALSVDGFEIVSKHLIELFGQPSNTEVVNDIGEKSHTWNVGNVSIYLGIIERFGLECSLKIGIEQK